MRFKGLIASLVSLASWGVAQAEPGLPVLAHDPDIQAAVDSVSVERIQRSIYVLTSFKTRHTLSDPAPNGDGIGAASAWIRAEFDRVSASTGGRLKVDLDTFTQTPEQPRIPQPTSITNIVATLPGTRPDSEGRIYVIGGHYDSMRKNVLNGSDPAPGANDDASGTAAVLEAARVLSSRSFPATLVFIAFAGEEQGLDGSRHWAQEARQKGLAVADMLNNDIIGASRSASGVIDRATVRVFAEGVNPTLPLTPASRRMLQTGSENDSPARNLARALRDIAQVYTPAMTVRIVYRSDRFGRGGDHQSFLNAGFPAVRLTEPAEDFLHEHEDPRSENGVTYGDTIDYVDFAYVANVAKVNVAALAALASAPAAPKGVQIESARLQNDSTLRWDPNAEPDLAGYRIVWRESTSPYWEHAVDVPKEVTRKTLEGVCKDNVVFGVEAFDSKGHVSEAVYPQPRYTL